MKPIDADALREKFADVLNSTYTDDYAKGFVAGLYAALNMPTLTPPNECLLQTADLSASFTSTSVGNGSDTTLIVLNCLWPWTFCIGCPCPHRLKRRSEYG